MMLVALTLIADLAATTPVRVELPEHVAIEVRHDGFVSHEASLEIRRTPKGFTDGARPIDEASLRALVAAAVAPAVTSLDVSRLPVDIAALRSAGEKAVAHLPRETAARFVDGLCDPKNLSVLETSLVQRVGYDDDPKVFVDLTLHEGEHVLLTSRAQGPFMLPWLVVRGDQSHRTYDPELARAIAALLPPRFLNRVRVSGERMPQELARMASVNWHDELQRAANDEKYGAQLAPLRARFAVTNEGAGFMTDFNANAEVWKAVVMAPASPRVSFHLWLTSKADHLASAAPFLRDANALAHRATAVPWIARLLKSQPTTRISIEYRDDRSLGRDAQKEILDGLRSAGKASLASAVAGVLDRSVGIQVEDADNFAVIWILLPDDRAFVTSRLRSPSGKPIDRVGTVVGPDGTPIRP